MKYFSDRCEDYFDLVQFLNPHLWERTVNKTGGRCSLWYTHKTEDHTNYTLGWVGLQNVTSTYSTNLEQSTMWQSEGQLHGLPQIGILESYSGGGYVANLGNTLNDAIKMVDDLIRVKWIDALTRVVFLEFNVYNANTGLFSLVTLMFEFPTYGGVFTYKTIQTVRLYRYTGAGGLLALISEIILVILCLALIGLEIWKTKVGEFLIFEGETRAVYQ